ncbi:MAG: hypothetical protein WDZ40_00835 [Candidatus Spechtbacterales bacterium]
MDAFLDSAVELIIVLAVLALFISIFWSMFFGGSRLDKAVKGWFENKVEERELKNKEKRIELEERKKNLEQ